MTDRHKDTVHPAPVQHQALSDNSEVRAAQITLATISANTGKSVSEILTDLRRLASLE